ncbi:unnamed protein product [Blepharisma stoltei]|uniref:Uncharacterized protein n=1 Tax=Blepharisma stoltei TaxID=1481888 RepID=A0AAU9KFG9_9CILI|nr:unnamed protein product [Blepharisma stoltei]
MESSIRNHFKSNFDSNNSHPAITRSLSPVNQPLAVLKQPEIPRPTYTRPMEMFHPKNEKSDNPGPIKNHGVSHKFYRQYTDRFYEDQTLDKATRLKIKELQSMRWANSARRQISDKDQKLLEIQKEQEQENIKQSRIKRLFIKHQELEQKLETAAVTIQRYARGYIIRKIYNKSYIELEKKKLQNYLALLENQVNEYWRNMGESANKAAIVIQKYVKGMKIRKYFGPVLKLRIEQRKKKMQKVSSVIQVCWKQFLASNYIENLRYELEKVKKLEKIRENLVFLRVKEFWKRNRVRFTVIKNKVHQMAVNSVLGLLKRASNKSVDIIDIKTEPTPIISKTLDSIKDSATIPEIGYIEHSSPQKQSKEITTEQTPYFHRISPNTIIETADPLNNRPSTVNSVVHEYTASFPQADNYSELARKPSMNKPPRPFILNSNYLRPTQAYISRTSKDIPEPENPKPKLFKKIRGKSYQRETKSRESYRQESIKIKEERAKSAESGKRWRTGGGDRLSSISYISSLAQMNQESALDLKPLIVEVEEALPKQKEEMDRNLLSSLEENTLKYQEDDDEEFAKVYVYKSTKSQSLEFKKALPDLYEFIENYSKNIKKPEKPRETPRSALQELSISSVKISK